MKTILVWPASLGNTPPALMSLPDATVARLAAEGVVKPENVISGSAVWPLASSAADFPASVPPGTVIANITDPYAGLGLGATTFTTFGTVPAQLALLNGQIVAGAAAAIGGTSYSVGVIATSGDGKRTIGEVLTLTARAASGALLTASPANPTIAANAAAGTLITAIGNVPAGVTPTVSPNDGRFAIAGDATNGWKVVTGLSALSAGAVNVTVSAVGAASVVVALTVTAAVVGKVIMLDSDLDSDCDDIHDLATLAYFVDNGEATIGCFTTSGSNDYSAPTARAMLDYLGYTSVPLGAYQGTGGGNSTSTYTQPTAAKFRPAGETRAAYESAVRVMRRTLLNSPDGSVYLVWTGSPNNLGALLASAGDDITPRTGLDLMQKKIAAIIGSAGYFDGSGTADAANIGGDLASANALASSGLPLVWDGLEIGTSQGTLGRIYPGTSENVNPLKYAWNRNNSQVTNLNGGYRNAWTLPAFLYIFRPAMVSLSTTGMASFDSSFKTTFTPGTGTSRYLTLNATAATINALNETWTFTTDVKHDAAYISGGVAAYKRFEAQLTDGAGATNQVVTDTSGKGHNGTLGASSTVAADDPGWVTEGLSCDGSAQFVNVPYSADFNPLGAVLVVVANPTVTTGTRQLMSRWGSTQQFQTRINAGNLEHVHQNGGTVTVVPGGAVSAGAWGLFTVLVENLTVVIRKGGVEVARQTVNGEMVSDTTDALLLGKRVAGDFFQGKMAYAAMYQRVLESDVPAIEARARSTAAGKGVTV